MNIIRVTNDSGVEFIVRVLREGDKYGRNKDLTYTSTESIIEFFDPSYIFTSCEYGEWVSRYLVSNFQTLPTELFYLDDKFNGWYLNGENILEIQEWLYEFCF
jgi:hypothetical protein